MTLLEYIKTVKKEIELNAQPFSIIELGALSTERKSIAIRPMPSGGGVSYHKGPRMRDIQFQVLAKSPSQSEVINTLDRIATNLEEFGAEVYSEPNYLSRDEQGYIYTCAFKANL